MKVKKLDSSILINNSSLVRFKQTGNIYEVMHSNKRSCGGYIRKIDKETYADIRTGEVFRFQHMESRADDFSNVSKSLALGRDIINTNVLDVSFCRWVTLTYAENMTDSKRLLSDFRDFNKRCRSNFGHYEYITAAEPQGRGAWHLHCVFIFPSKAPYMDSKVVADCWRKGFVKVRKLDNVDNVGAYLTAYLGDMEIDDCDVQGKVKEVNNKKYIKGGRLHLYPAGFHIFRYSKGIKKPLVSNITYSSAMDIVGDSSMTYSKSVVLEDETKGYRNTLTYEYYNKLR